MRAQKVARNGPLDLTHFHVHVSGLEGQLPSMPPKRTSGKRGNASRFQETSDSVGTEALRN